MKMISMKRSIKLIISAIAFVFSVAMFFINSPKAEAAGSKTVDSLTISQMYANKDTGKCGNFSWNPSDLNSITSSGFTYDFWTNSDHAFKIVWTKPSDMAYPSKLKYGYSIADGVNKDSASKNFNSDASTKPSLPMGGDGTRQYNVEEITLYSNYDKVVFWLGHSYMADDLNVTSITFELKTATAAVKGTAGTGVKSVFFSTSADTTSGSASGTEFEKGKTVYGYAVLKEGYKAPYSWTLIDGTANSENSIYRIGSTTVDTSDYNFGTINAELKTKYIIFDKNGGGNSTSQQITYGQSATLSPISRNGYSFLGWNSKQDGTGTAYGDENGATLTVEQVNEMVLASGGNPTLYAQWSVNTYTIIFDTNGGTGGPDPIELKYGDPFPELTELPTREGYEFNGYSYTEPKYSTVRKIYNADGTVALDPNESYIYEDNAHLDPIWKGLPYPVTISAGTGVDEVFLSKKLNQTSGDPSGTKFTNGESVVGYIKLKRGYKAPYGWTRVTDESEDDIGGAIYSNYGIVNLGYDFGTVNAILGQYPVNITKGTGLKDVKVSANADGTNLVNSGSKFEYQSTVYAYATLAKGYKAPSTWTLISGTAETEDALYLVDSIEKIDIDSTFGTINATPKTYPVTLDGLTDPINATYDADMPKLSVLPTKAGYTLVGYWNVDGTTQYYNNLGESTHIWDQDGSNINLVSRWTKDMTVTSSGYDADYDGSSHGITINVTDPEDYTISYESTSDNYNLAEAPTYTNVGEYTVKFKIVKDGYTVYYGSETVVIKEVDKEELKTLINNCDNYYNSIKNDYTNIADDFNNVINDAKAIRDNENVTSEQVADVITALTNALNQAKADVTEVKINAIGTVSYSDTTKALIDAARNYYDNLDNDTQKGLVENYQTLLDAENLYNAVDAFVVKVNAFGNFENTKEFKDKVKDADDYYGTLGDAEKNLISSSYTNALSDAKAVVDFYDKFNTIGDSEDTEAFRNKVSEARNTYDELSGKQADAVQTDVYNALVDYEKAIEVMDIINLIGDVEYTSTSKAKIDVANNAYDALTDTQKALVANYGKLEQANLDYDSVKDAIAKLKAMIPYSYADECKDAIDEARNYYNNLSDYQKTIFGEDELNLIIDYEKAYEANDLINAITDIENTDDYKNALQQALDAYNALTEEQKELIDDSFANLLEDRDAAFNVIEKINDAKKVKYTKDSKDKLDATLDAYDKLTDEQKTLVVNYNDLIKADKDYKEVEKVVNEINNLGKLSYSEDTNKKITDARKNYTELTNDQSSFFPEETKKTLENYENAYVVLAKIYSIGEVEYTEESEKLIADAKNDYEALNNAEKGLISDEDLAILNNANDSYSSKNTAGTVWLVLLLIIVIITLGAGIFCFTYLLVHKPRHQKAMSVSPFGLIFLGSHLADGGFVTLYVFTALAVIVWIAVLVVYILKKKNIIRVGSADALAIEDGNQTVDLTNDEEENKKDEELVEETEEDEDTETKTDSEGNTIKIRYIKSFKAKLIQSSDEIKKQYVELKKEILSYEGTKSKITWHFETITVGKNAILRFAIRGKTLCVYYALSYAEYINTKFKVENVTTKKHSATSCLYRIKNEKRFNYAKELIKKLAKKNGLTRGLEPTDDFYLPYEERDPLIEQGLIKVNEVRIDSNGNTITTEVEALKKEETKQVEEVKENKPVEEEKETEPVKLLEVKDEPILAPVVVKEEVEETESEDEEELVNSTDESDEEEEVETTTDSEGNVFKIQYVNSFKAKMILATDELKQQYIELKKAILSYEGTKSKMTWHFETVSVGKNILLRFAIRGKTLCVYYALNAEEYNESKYKVENITTKKHSSASCLYRIKNERRFDYAKELIEELAKKNDLVKGNEPTDDFYLPYEEKESLIEQGLIKKNEVKVTSN